MKDLDSLVNIILKQKIDFSLPEVPREDFAPRGEWMPATVDNTLWLALGQARLKRNSK